MMTRSSVRATKITFGLLAFQLEQYRADCGQYPTEEENLNALFSASASCADWGPEPYWKTKAISYICDPKELDKLKARHSQDGWNHRIVYRTSNNLESFELLSYGKDGIEGGEGLNADISSLSDEVN